MTQQQPALLGDLQAGIEPRWRAACSRPFRPAIQPRSSKNNERHEPPVRNVPFIHDAPNERVLQADTTHHRA